MGKTGKPSHFVDRYVPPFPFRVIRNWWLIVSSHNVWDEEYYEVHLPSDSESSFEEEVDESVEIVFVEDSNQIESSEEKPATEPLKLLNPKLNKRELRKLKKNGKKKGKENRESSPTPQRERAVEVEKEEEEEDPFEVAKRSYEKVRSEIPESITIDSLIVPISSQLKARLNKREKKMVRQSHGSRASYLKENFAKNFVKDGVKDGVKESKKAAKDSDAPRFTSKQQHSTTVFKPAKSSGEGPTQKSAMNYNAENYFATQIANKKPRPSRKDYGFAKRVNVECDVEAWMLRSYSKGHLTSMSQSA